MSLPFEGISVIKAGMGSGTGTLLLLGLILTILTCTVTVTPIGGHQYPPGPPQSAPTQAPQEVSNFVDGSGPIFSMYLELASEEDKKMAENWKADADGILIFTGLFSAAVASLISVSIQDIRPNPQDTSNFYLANIYQVAVDPNRPNISLPSSPPPFSPPNYAVWVNALWFLSLLISLTCALLATLVQQWARRYLKVTQPRYSPHKRARIRAFFAEGVQKLLLPWAVESLPALLHVSLFLFFAGLAVFICNVNLTIFKLLLSWIGVCTIVYGCFTVMPIFRHDSPYYTPLTSSVWPVITGTLYGIFLVLRFFTWSIRVRCLEVKFHEIISLGVLKTAENTALNLPSGVDTRAFLWTFYCLDEDHELERFFSGLPGFCSSKVVDNPLLSLTREQKSDLSAALTGLLDSTFSSDVLPELVKSRRAIICAKALDPAVFPDAYSHILSKVLSVDQYRGPLATEFGRAVQGWGNRRAASVVQHICAGIVATAQRRDDSWFILASTELDVPETILRDDAAKGENLSLAILIHVTRLQFSCCGQLSWPDSGFSKVLEAASRFNIHETSLDLQHEFCALWNQIVLKVQENDRLGVAIARHMLEPIRDVYIALHRDTDSAPTPSPAPTNIYIQRFASLVPSSFPLCKIHCHHPDSAPHTHDVSASTTCAHAVLHDHDNAALFPSFLSSSPDTPSSSASAPLPVDETFIDVLPPDHKVHDISVAVSTTLFAYQTTLQCGRIIATPPDPVTARATPGGIDAFARIVPLSTSQPLVSNPPPSPKASTSHTPSDVPDIPSSPTPTPNLDDVLLTGPPLSSDSAVTGSDHTPSSPETHLSVPVPAASGPCRQRRPSAPPDSTAAAEGEGSVSAVLCMETDALCPSSAIRKDIMTAPDLPPQPRPPSSVTDLAIAGPSWRSLGAEHTEGYPPQYDIV